MSNVDDPEKHFLGNLLEDDSFSCGTPLLSRNNETNASSSTPLSSVFAPLGTSVSSFWPEPPPPYSASPRESWLSSLHSQQKQNPLEDFLSSGWKEQTESNVTANVNFGVGDDFYSRLTNQSLSTAPPLATPTSAQPFSSANQPQIHHFHHNHIHHTHTHNVQVQNHHYIATPTALENLHSLTTIGSERMPTSAHNESSSAYSYLGSEQAQQYPWTTAAPQSQKSQSSLASWKRGTGNTTTSNTVGSDDVTSSLSTVPNISPTLVEEKKLTKSYAAASNAQLVKKTSTPAIGSEKQRKSVGATMSSSMAPSPPRIVVKGQPHSAPVVTKMPFSYRDVAARVDQTSSSNTTSNHEHSPTQQTKPRTNTSNASANGGVTSKTKRADVVGSTDASDFTDAKRASKERISRSDNEFQKITRKNNKGTNGNTEKKLNPIVMPVLENKTAVYATSRYDVLSNLQQANNNDENQENISKKNSTGRVPLIQEVYSRSGSPAFDDDQETCEEGEELIRVRASSNGNSNANGRKDKKRTAVLAAQRRRQRGKKEPNWTENPIIDFICKIAFIFACYAGDGAKWTLQLICDFCYKTIDVLHYYSKKFMGGLVDYVKSTFILIVSFVYHFFYVIWTVLCALNPKRWFDEICEDAAEPFQWGCKKELPLPNSASELIDRLYREPEENRDAYTVFGLRSDCSDGDIKRYFKRLSALVSPDKCTLDGAEEAFDLVRLALDAIGTPLARAEYTPVLALDSDEHRAIENSYLIFRDHIRSIRDAMFCDCGKRHMRYETKIAPASARWCSRCETDHPAKQNDIWQEWRWYWRLPAYYTCSDNVVYDISEWANCKSNQETCPDEVPCFVRFFLYVGNANTMECRRLRDQFKATTRKHQKQSRVCRK